MVGVEKRANEKLNTYLITLVSQSLVFIFFFFLFSIKVSKIRKIRRREWKKSLFYSSRAFITSTKLIYHFCFALKYIKGGSKKNKKKVLLFKNQIKFFYNSNLFYQNKIKFWFLLVCSNVWNKKKKISLYGFVYILV